MAYCEYFNNITDIIDHKLQVKPRAYVVKRLQTMNIIEDTQAMSTFEKNHAIL